MSWYLRTGRPPFYDFDEPAHHLRKLPAMADRLSLGSVLKAARQVRGARQGQIADELGVSSAALSHVEAGRNHATRQILTAYAHHVVDEPDQAEFIEIMRGSDQLPLDRLARMINPAEPEKFLLLFEDAHRRADFRSDSSTDRGPRSMPPAQSSMGYQSRQAFAPDSLKAVDSFVSDESVQRRWTQEGSHLRVLQDFLASHGGKPVITGPQPVDLGIGLEVTADLLEMTHSLIVEFKALNSTFVKSVMDLAGKAAVLKANGFQFVVCLTEAPTTDQHIELVELLRKAGASVIWPSGSSKAGDDAFEGDRLL